MAARQAAINASVNAQGSPNARNVKQPKIFRLLCEITVIKPPKFSRKPSPGIPRCTRLDYSPSMYQRIVDRTLAMESLCYELSPAYSAVLSSSFVSYRAHDLRLRLISQ